MAKFRFVTELNEDENTRQTPSTDRPKFQFVQELNADYKQPQVEQPKLSTQGLRELDNNISTRPTGWNHDPLPGENTNLSPFVANTLNTLTTPLRSFFDNPFNQRAGQTGAEVVTGVKNDNITSTGNKGADVAASLLGGIAGFGVNPGGALNAGSTAFKLGENALSKFPQLSKLPKLAQAGAKLASGSVAYDLGNSVSNGDAPNPKDMAIAAAENAALGLLPLGIGKGAEALKEARLPKPVYKPLESNPFKDIQTAYKSPSLHDVKQGEYNQLFSGPDTQFKPAAMQADNPSQYFEKTQSDLEAAFGRPLDNYKINNDTQNTINEISARMDKHVQDIAASLKQADKQTNIYSIRKRVKDMGGISQGNLDILEEQKVIPNWIKNNKTGRPLDEVADELGMNSNDLLAAISDSSYKPKDYETEAYRIAHMDPGYQALSNTLDALSGELPGKQTLNNKPLLKPREKSSNIVPKLEQPRLVPPNPGPRQWTNEAQIKNPLNPFDVPKPKVETPKLEIPGNTGLNPKLGTQPLNTEPPKLDYTKIHDITGFEGSSKDMYRILEQRLGKEAADHMMDPFTQSKGAYADLQNNLANEMKSVIVDNLGIKKGSMESALVQKYGEKAITLDELKAQAPDKWQNIVKADQWFRDKYNWFIDQINASKKAIYPNAEQTVAKIEQQMTETQADKSMTATEKRETLKNLQSSLDDAMRNKIVPKREDYYRHFQEMEQGLSGLKNIFENPTMIDPRLVGKTAWTKPKSKWASIAQQRLGNKTEYDAVGGFLNYLPQASYAIHIDPHISRFRALSDEIANSTVDTKNANNLINTLQNYANDLSGKTNPADRYMMENVPGGRTTVAALGWLQNRIKSNVILGNLGSAVSQVANIPNGIAFAKQYSAEGAAKTLKTIIKPSKEMAQSPFLKERYGGPGSKAYQQFDTSFLNKPKQFATWMLETADKLGTEFVWNSAYAKGAAEGAVNPIKFADDATRKLVAGRGIGEVPLMYKSKIVGLMAPFQLEVGNLWHVQKDMVSSKDFAGLATLYLSMYVFNKLAEHTKGSGVTFDPIQAVVDASQDGLTPIQRGGRLAGELFSNVPFGQNIAKSIPEYGGNMFGVNVPSRKALFGKNDPTRYGSGNLILDTMASTQKAAQNLVLPFGGNQVAKTVKGAQGLINKGVTDKNNNLMYPVSPSTPNSIKGLMFGPSGFTEAQNYYGKDRRALTAKQTEQVNRSLIPGTEYEKIQVQRKLDSLSAKMKDTSKDKSLSDIKKALLLEQLKKQYEKAKSSK